MKHTPYAWILRIALFILLIGGQAEGFTDTQKLETHSESVSIPYQGDLFDRLKKAGLQPSITQKVEPPQGLNIPEIPRSIVVEDLGSGDKARLDHLERKREKGKLTETEYQLEKDTLFREANLTY